MKISDSLRHRALILAAATAAPLAAAAPVSTDYDAKPPVVTQSATPLVMLTMSNDHQLFYKAYSDWDDIDGNGAVEASYSSSIEYYGYFNSAACYEYNATDKRFEPKGAADASYYCSGNAASGRWSGNFLNWASMTRIDALRKVLYGGKRYNESAGDTTVVLERAFLPTDAHSFAKYYTGSDLNKLTPFGGSEITLCNTTYTASGKSQDSTEPPLIRVAKGDFRYWAANERWQCTWDGEHGDNSSGTNTTGSQTSDPNKTSDGLGNAEYVARVQVCASGYRESNCRAYTDGTNTYYRPAGLLQRFGENGQIHFGLLTGSYDKNKSGGVVRRDIVSFEPEVRDDGTFDSSVDGIVSSIDRLRIANYDYGGTDNGTYNQSDDCKWGKSSFDEGDCSNWGNPISEMYLEAVRYFAGLTPNSSFTGDDTSYISGLTQLSSWTDPLNSDNRCASCNIVVINASDISYDDNGLSMTGLPKGGSTTPSATAWTKTVGDNEEITNNKYFVGESGSDTDQLCTAKTITNLGAVEGVCPNAPRLSGTYNMAGIAYWAHTKDIREDLDDQQSVNTYAISLAPAVPNIRIPVPNSDKTVTILPACRNTSFDPDANCAIVDFKILSQDLDGGTGSFYVNWEDSEQGGDYDQDMKGVIGYSINALSNEITVVTKVNEESTPFSLGFGYVITGTTADGFHVHSGVEDFTYTDSAGVTDCSGKCNVGDAASSHTYTIGSSSASMLKDPLWYTAKYGGFKDYDRDGKPNETQDAEWDTRDNDGNATPDGNPDNYYPVTNPKQLESRMEQVFNNILDRISSGTAAAVVSNSASGVGAVYQALYQPLTQNGDDQVSWTGFLHALFIDNKGLLREDTNNNSALDDYSTDLVVEIYFDEIDRETRAQRYTTSDQGKTLAASGIPVTIADLEPIWQAHEQLSSVTYSDSNRNYESAANTGRHILTAVNGTTKDFEPSVFTGTDSLYRYLGLNDTATAEALVQFIRGKEGLSNTRSRTVDYDDDGSDEVMRLGDIIHSSPVVVGAPDEPYPIVHSDTSYVKFKDQYAGRRQVVYVGANDGMIHAFNGGFWDSGSNAFKTTPPGTDKDSNDDGADDTAHPLGSELWAYVPENLLPHLRWLKEPDYPHVYYMDGAPLVFDANIFPSDTTHPNGWGTVLVMGMRLGGAPVGVDSDGDGSNDKTMRSAYVVLDITDPEQPPTLLAEITHPKLGFTTSKPAVIKRRAIGTSNDWTNPAVNEWYLAFGSGPNQLDTATSDQKAQFYLYDLDAKTFVSGFGPAEINEPKSFVGDVQSIDWDIDYKDDAAYFGTVAGTVSSPSGALYRLHATASGLQISTLMDPDKPFLSAPSLRRSNAGERWVRAGTGRLLVQADIASTEQQGFYAVREPKDTTGEFDWSTVSTSSLQQVTGVQVFEDGTVKDPNSVLPTTPSIDTYSKLASHIKANTAGWYRLLAADGTNPASRNVTPATQISSILLYSVYAPSTDACMPEGYSTLYALNYETGVAEPYGTLGLDTSVKHTTTDGDVYYLVRESTSRTAGLSSGPVVHSGTGGTTVVENYSTGALGGSLVTLPPVSSSRLSWREIDL